MGRKKDNKYIFFCAVVIDKKTVWYCLTKPFYYGNRAKV